MTVPGTPRPGVVLPAYDRSEASVGWAHIGVGNFHRTHQALYVERCLHRPAQSAWGILGIGVGDSPASRAKAEAFARQGGLYSLTEFAPDGGHASRVVGALLDYAHAPRDPARVVGELTQPSLRIVTLTVTEGGYLTDPATGEVRTDHPDLVADAAGERPTVFGLLVRALAARRRAGVEPFTLVSCDNLRHNGDHARAALLGAAQVLAPDMVSWIGDNVATPNGMVDRIAPSVTDADRARLNELTGLDDRLPVMSESYLQWVLEDRFPAGRPRLEEVGVEFVADIDLHETMKTRMLNASHMLLAFPALLSGYRLVHEGLADPLLHGLAERFLLDDVTPILTAPGSVSLPDYAHSVLERFSNPAVGDQWARVATDGATKIATFHTDTIAELLRRGGDLRREAFLLACYERFLTGVDEHGDAFEVGPPTLPDEDLARLSEPDGLGLLRAGAFAPLRLAGDPRFTVIFERMRSSLSERGARGTIEAERLA